MFRWQLTNVSTSSNSNNTGAPAAANTLARASVPGAVHVSAAVPSAATPSSPASWRARSIQGVSRPSTGSQALPATTPTRAGGTPACRLRSGCQRRQGAGRRLRRHWPSDRGPSGCVSCRRTGVTSVSTGAVCAVRPANRRRNNTGILLQRSRKAGARKELAWMAVVRRRTTSPGRCLVNCYTRDGLFEMKKEEWSDGKCKGQSTIFVQQVGD